MSNELKELKKEISKECLSKLKSMSLDTIQNFLIENNQIEIKTIENKKLSIHNQAYLIFQANKHNKPIPNIVAGYKQFLSNGYQVKKLEKSYLNILVPINIKYKIDTDNNTSNEIILEKIKFKIVSVFDINQCEKIEV